jgi:hypothetical protein
MSTSEIVYFTESDGSTSEFRDKIDEWLEGDRTAEGIKTWSSVLTCGNETFQTHPGMQDIDKKIREWLLNCRRKQKLEAV